MFDVNILYKITTILYLNSYIFALHSLKKADYSAIENDRKQPENIAQVAKLPAGRQDW